MLVEEVLKMVLKNSGFTYKTTGKSIAIVRQKEKKPEKPTVVTGQIVDEKGNPIPGATVMIQGTSQGVATDVNGHYTIEVKPTDILRISFIITAFPGRPYPPAFLFMEKPYPRPR